MGLSRPFFHFYENSVSKYLFLKTKLIYPSKNWEYRFSYSSPQGLSEIKFYEVKARTLPGIFSKDFQRFFLFCTDDRFEYPRDPFPLLIFAGEGNDFHLHISSLPSRSQVKYMNFVTFLCRIFFLKISILYFAHLFLTLTRRTLLLLFFFRSVARV